MTRIIKKDFEEVFGKYDFVMGPVSPTLPFKLGQKSDDPMAMYLADVYTTSMSLAGVPAISVPCGFVGNLPVGLQITASHFEEGKLIQAAHAYEQASEHYKKRPGI